MKFQTSVKESEQSEAMEIFLLFESGNSGHLTLSQFKQALYEMEDQDHVKLNLDLNICEKCVFHQSSVRSQIKIENKFNAFLSLQLELNFNQSVFRPKWSSCSKQLMLTEMEQ